MVGGNFAVIAKKSLGLKVVEATPIRDPRSEITAPPELPGWIEALIWTTSGLSIRPVTALTIPDVSFGLKPCKLGTGNPSVYISSPRAIFSLNEIGTTAGAWPRIQRSIHWL